jgi:hypothetical protein
MLLRKPSTPAPAGAIEMAISSLAADWADFDPREYLDEYYTDLGAENLALLRFFVEACRDLPRDGVLLDFGGGPTVYPLIAAATHVREIHYSDYLDANLEEVRKWLRGDEAAFDWFSFVEKTIELETEAPCSAVHVERRKSEIRKRVTRLLHCDASRTPPIDGCRAGYDVVVTNFCAESATSDRGIWRAFMHNITSLVKPGGKLILSALKGATCYSVGSKTFPAVDISEEDLAEVLTESGFPEKHLAIRSTPADRPSRLYEGVIMAVATKMSEEPRS